MPRSSLARTTSAAAYRWVMDNVASARIRYIYDTVYARGPMTDSEIAEELGIPRDSASPRVRDLMAMGALRELPEAVKCAVTGRMCRAVDVTADIPVKQPRKQRFIRVPVELLAALDTRLPDLLRLSVTHDCYKLRETYNVGKQITELLKLK